MSHFTVLVFGKNPEEQLAPYQEYDGEGTTPEECVEFKDCTKEVLKEWEEGREVKYKTLEGDFYKWEVKSRFGEDALDTFEKVDVLYKDSYTSIEKFADYWYGSIKINDKFGYYYNPNSKWDWKQLGGRWSGFFKLKNIGQISIPTEEDISQFVEHISAICNIQEENIFNYIGLYQEFLEGKIDFHKLMERKLEDSDYLVGYYLEKEIETFLKVKYPDSNSEVGDLGLGVSPPKVGWVDQTYKKDVDFETMEKERELKVRGNWHDAQKEKPNQRAFYYGIKENDIEESYVERNKRFSTFAVVKDGEWYERGDMGWWGCVTDEKEPGRWEEEFNKLLNSVSDDTLLSMYDCHI